MAKGCERMEKLDVLRNWAAAGKTIMQDLSSYGFQSAAVRVLRNTELIQKLSDQWQQLLAGGGKGRYALSNNEKRDYKNMEDLADNTSHFKESLYYAAGIARTAYCVGDEGYAAPVSCYSRSYAGDAAFHKIAALKK